MSEIYEYLDGKGATLSEDESALENEILSIYNINRCQTLPTLTYVVDSGKVPVSHPANGACYIDQCISNELCDYLAGKVYSSLPVAIQRDRKTALCSERRYYSDWSSVLSLAISSSVSRIGLGNFVVFQNVRYLNYDTVDSELTPHIDLSKTSPLTGRRSTHTILLYLTDFDEGGETALMEELNGEERRGAPNILCDVKIRKGRCLIFNHDTPHLGRKVEASGKMLIRTEGYFL